MTVAGGLDMGDGESRERPLVPCTPDDGCAERLAAGSAGALTARRAVLMGDPTHFAIRGGANPHTRTRWGRRKRVDRERAIAQWHGLARTLERHGVAVFVVPAAAECPGLVYPANAGVLHPVEAPWPAGRKRFYLSNLLPTRAAEQPIYAEFLRRLGMPTARLQAAFEGEADFFPLGDRYLFTHGAIERQRFVPRLGIPPYRRVYGFRSEIAALAELAAIVMDVEVLAVPLVNEAYYHGDTVLCSWGPGRRFLFAHLEGIERRAAARLRAILGDHLVPLSAEDAALYAANSYSLAGEDGAWVFMPQGVSERLQAQVRERGVTPVLVDVSEFLRKGGGSVKCMIGDLGPWTDEGAGEDALAFRRCRRYGSVYHAT
jgi:N-dimethylarginine dimethylaminohydrolase